MSAQRPLDEMDHEILGLLRKDARRTVKDIAMHVGLSPAPVQRRIERMERSGLIAGYTVVLGQGGVSLQAFIEIRYTGKSQGDDVLTMLGDIAEVQNIYTTAGDTDVLVHVHADDIAHLTKIVAKVRAQGNPLSTKTLIVLQSRDGLRSLSP